MLKVCTKKDFATLREGVYSKNLHGEVCFLFITVVINFLQAFFHITNNHRRTPRQNSV